jgi:hypothetical protein
VVVVADAEPGEGELAPLAEFIRRVLADPALFDEVLQDPFRSLRTHGVSCTAREVKQLLSIPGATDAELLAVIDWRLRSLEPAVAAALLAQCRAQLFPQGEPPAVARRRPACDTGLPLGVRPGRPLAPAQLATLDVLARYDLREVADYLREAGTLPPIWLQDALLEFRRYLGLRYVHGRSFPMFSEQVDQVWHTCVLFTELYADLGTRVFGTFLHHDPWDDPKSPNEVLAMWHDFAAAYAQLYGAPGYLWTLRRAAPLPAPTPLR